MKMIPPSHAALEQKLSSKVVMSEWVGVCVGGGGEALVSHPVLSFFSKQLGLDQD